MTFSIIVSLLLAPAISWMGHFYYKDQFFPESISKTLITYFTGFAAAFPCFHFYRLLPLIGIPAEPSGLMNGSQGLFFLSSATFHRGQEILLRTGFQIFGLDK
jgi:RsiW-degrading membrane proteinase PrsW (M82 family)